jgi:hypothetical protein
VTDQDTSKWCVGLRFRVMQEGNECSPITALETGTDLCSCTNEANKGGGGGAHYRFPHKHQRKWTICLLNT